MRVRERVVLGPVEVEVAAHAGEAIEEAAALPALERVAVVTLDDAAQHEGRAVDDGGEVQAAAAVDERGGGVVRVGHRARGLAVGAHDGAAAVEARDDDVAVVAAGVPGGLRGGREVGRRRLVVGELRMGVAHAVGAVGEVARRRVERERLDGLERRHRLGVVAAGERPGDREDGDGDSDGGGAREHPEDGT